jgi:hypothetical protein
MMADGGVLLHRGFYLGNFYLGNVLIHDNHVSALIDLVFSRTDYGTWS